MNQSDYEIIRVQLASLDAASAHSASGADRPKIDEIYAPEHHAGALDPNVTIVLGARGAGKSFWAGVLGDPATRAVASEAYARLGLKNVVVTFGFTGLPNDGSVSRATIDANVPVGLESTAGVLLWRCVILRGLLKSIDPNINPKISEMMVKYADPEEWETACSEADKELFSQGKRALIIFDALDGLAVEWDRLRNLTDALLETTWYTRGYKAVRAKLFMRPDQIRDVGLRFVELPKLIAGSTKLAWSGVDLYGMLFSRFGRINNVEFQAALARLFAENGVSTPPTDLVKLRTWPLAYDKDLQDRVFSDIAGPYMGRSNKNGKTYYWSLKHLEDGHNEVTPRSFLTLMIEAAKASKSLISDQALTPEGIRHGLREASKVRVDQLNLEFPWIKRVLAPLARLQVPCADEQIIARWRETETIQAIQGKVDQREFLGPFDPNAPEGSEVMLINSLIRIGVLLVRNDGRYDMPDLFRVAARLLKKGAVAPHS
jgi:hypothetical protein